MTISGIHTSTSAYADSGGSRLDSDRRQSVPEVQASEPGAMPGGAKSGCAPETLTPEAAQEVSRLKQRDAEVKAHEQAHMAAGGAAVQGGARYTFEKGPDGRQYAVGGEVSIDTSPENSPDATIRKMQMVKRAAMAPADPSSQDRSVAARAESTAAKARTELARENASGGKEPSPSASGVSPAQAARAYHGVPSGADKPPPFLNLSV